MQKVNRRSENLENENLEKLRKVFPEFVKDEIVDFDALKAFFEENGELPKNQEKYGLNWAGKSNAFRAIKTPTTGTLAPDEEESKNFENTENLFIEGDNLEVLKLLQKHYREKIKMIYIDPPYNTGKDFIYKDNFKEDKSDYYERTSQNSCGIPMTTNRDSSGRYHSDWLTMMYPRLFLARSLLKEDGVIFISIGDAETANLRIASDEIFGEENFEGHIHWRRRHNQPNDPKKLIALVAEHILVYAKNSEVLREAGVGKLDLTGKFSNPDNDSRGDWNSKPWKIGSNQNGSKYSIKLPSGRIVAGEWMGEKSNYERLLSDNRIVFPRNGDGLPRKKIFKSEREEEGQAATNWFPNQEFGNNQEATDELAELFDGKKNLFDNPKPVRLVKNIIRLGNLAENEIVLDFFAGSGTTAHAVMDQNAEDVGNRKWICVQLPEITDENSEARKAGFENIAQIARERIRRAGDKIDKGDIGFKALKLTESNYRENIILTNKDDKDKLLKQEKLLIERPLIDGFDEKAVVYEILTKEGFDLNSEVVKENNIWTATDEERKIVVSFAETVDTEEVEKLSLNESGLFVCLDSALDDTKKTNILRRKFNIKVI